MPSPRKPTDPKHLVGKRPKAASRAYVLGLLREHSLMPEVPADIAAAVLEVMVNRGVLVENPKGHLEIAGKVGATLDLPDKSGPALRSAIVEMIGRDRRMMSVMGRLVQGSGARGSGAPSSSRGSAPARVDETKEAQRELDYALRTLKELEWHADDVVLSFGKESDAEGLLITEFVIGLVRQECEGLQGRIKQPEPKGTTRRQVRSDSGQPLH